MSACDREQEPAAEPPQTVLTAEPVALGTWRTDEVAPIDGREGFAAAQSGAQIFIWGGHTRQGQFDTYLNSGAVVNTTTMEWNELPTDGAPTARWLAAATSLPNGFAVWGGRDGMKMLGDGARLVGSQWQPISSIGAPRARTGHIMVWTGSRVLIWGGHGEPDQKLNDGGLYNPNSDTWTPTTVAGAPSPRAHAGWCWTGNRLFVFGGEAAGPAGGGGVYDPAANEWRRLGATGAPSPRHSPAVACVGGRAVVWGGMGPGGEPLGDGALYDLDSEEWRPMEARNAPSPRGAALAIAANRHVLLWGGTARAERLADGARYRSDVDRWEPLAKTDAPEASGARAFWTQRGLLVWGGRVGDRGFPAQVFRWSESTARDSN